MTRGFTLIELLVIVAIIGILSSVVFASLSVARDKSRIAAGFKLDANIRHGIGDQLLGQWTFDECSGTTAVDSSGSGAISTFVGIPAWTMSTATGNGCAITTGSGSYIDVTNMRLIIGSSPFTIAAWVNTNQLSRYSGAVSIGSSAGGQAAYIGTVNTAQVGPSNSIGGGIYGTNMGSPYAVTGKWAHVAMTYTAGAVRLYVNGTEVARKTMTPALSGSPVRIGRIGTDTIFDFDGSIDDVRIYSVTFTASAVHALYAQGVAAHSHARSESSISRIVRLSEK